MATFELRAALGDSKTGVFAQDVVVFHFMDHALRDEAIRAISWAMQEEQTPGSGTAPRDETVGLAETDDFQLGITKLQNAMEHLVSHKEALVLSAGCRMLDGRLTLMSMRKDGDWGVTSRLFPVFIFTPTERSQ